MIRPCLAIRDQYPIANLPTKRMCIDSSYADAPGVVSWQATLAPSAKRGVIWTLVAGFESFSEVNSCLATIPSPGDAVKG